MKNIRTLLLFFLFFLVALGVHSSFAETLTLTTYYPSPLGAYDQVLFVPKGTPTACNAAAEGTVYYDSTTHDLSVCKNTGWSSENLWTQTGTFLYPQNTTWNVGIGTASPSSNLEVWGSSPVVKITQNPGIPGNSALTISAAGNNNTATINVGSAVIQSNTAGSGALLLNPTSGNVGIGTASPGATLNVMGNVGIGILNQGSFKFAVKTSSWGDGMILFDSNTFPIAQLLNLNGTGGALDLHDGSNNSKVFLRGSGDSYIAGGNVGIGTTTPGTAPGSIGTAILDVNGTIIIRGGGGASPAGKVLTAIDGNGTAAWQLPTYQ